MSLSDNNHLLFTILTDYCIFNNDFKTINSLNKLDKTINLLIATNELFIKKKSSRLLINIFLKNGYDYQEVIDIITPTNTIFNTNKKDNDNIKDFNSILRSFYDTYYNENYHFTHYIKTFNEYKKDKLNPMKRLPGIIYKRIEIEKTKSINLNMALDHAEKKYSLNKAREIGEHYEFNHYNKLINGKISLIY